MRRRESSAWLVRAVAELLGTAFLVAAVIGSGIAAVRLSPDDVGLQLLENSLVTGAALVALILALQPVSAAFNPVVTLVERALGAVTTARAAVLIVAQVVGGVRRCCRGQPDVRPRRGHLSTHDRAGAGHLARRGRRHRSGWCWSSSAAVRSGRADTVAFAVGGYITAAYWFTSSTSFANPAVTLARMFSDTFAGIAPVVGADVRRSCSSSAASLGARCSSGCLSPTPSASPLTVDGPSAG